MAADLFESYAVTLVAALILGRAAFGEDGLVYPLIVSAVGVLIAIVGVFITRLRPSDRNGLTAINRAFYISAALSAALVAVVTFLYLPNSFPGFEDPAVSAEFTGNPQVLAIGAVVIGIVLAAAIQALTGYFTETAKRPVQDIGKSSLTGAATVILAGISVGLESAVYSALVIGAGVFGAYLLGGGSIILSLFAVAMAGIGLLTTGRRDRGDGHVRPDLGQRAGHRGDVRRRGRGRRADAHRAGRGRQHHEGDHQGHRDRDRGAGRDRALRVVPGHDHHRAA